MIQVHVGEARVGAWSHVGGDFACGYAFAGSEWLQGISIASAAFPASADASRSRGLASLNGFFSVVRHASGRLDAAVDRVRSLPLFYGCRGHDFFLSDQASWVRAQVGDDSIDETAAAEFQMTGYVTGSETLYPNVKQLQAGERLRVEDGEGGPVVRTSRYAEFLHRADGGHSDAAALTQRLDAVLVRIFERLLKSIGGRPIVLPLSGGFDSRLLALMLKRLGCTDVTCFSYGLEGNWESRVSQELAQKLGFRWEFVPYTRERWAHWFHSEERKRYYAFADGLSSIPHLQDWPAVWELKRLARIPDDGVFVPGHTGDFISGGHIPRALGYARSCDLDRLVELIEDKHYSLNGPKAVGEAWTCDARRKLRNRFDGRVIETAEQAADAYEWWEWQERQAKFICNAVRVYEFWGYEWRMPLWDAELTEFWEGVPFSLRLGKRLYNQYVLQMGRDLALPPPNDERWTRNLVRGALSALRLTKLHRGVRRAIGGRQAGRTYREHFLGWYGVMPEEVFRRHYTGQEHLNSFLTRERLGRIAF